MRIGTAVCSNTHSLLLTVYEAGNLLLTTQDAARIMLTALSFHWDRNVIQLAVQQKMKRFVAHRHCQESIAQVVLLR